MTDQTQSTTAALKLAFGLMLIGTVGAAVVASGLDAITVVFWRSVVGAIFLAVWCLATGILPDRSLTRRNLMLGAVAGVSLVLSWAAFFQGILMTSISTATILFHTQPFWIVLLSAVILKERISRAQMAWLCMAFVGVALASNLTLSSGELDPDWASGVLILLGGALVYAVTAVAGKELRGQRGEVTTLIQTVAGALIFLPFVNLSQDIALPSWSFLVMIGVLQTGVAWVMVYSAYPHVSTPLIAVLSFVNPMTAILSDWYFYGHLIGLAQTAGMALIVIGTLGVKLGWQPWPTNRSVT
ncbi:DMT family transporter [Phaeobacter sp. PT47_59]|uniref:DMT family transporter n=1 Tax=Phaeobacter sp. PT47_59 TaxID=3029979 RepID=UPI0023800CFC|nr:DMT family transporter [Phaeobacter sp. PT47_59]MDE4176704.1 DMT family transporter [Phaeobacter sp. PT47_59]